MAYISIPNILEHYDACIAIPACDPGPYIASPVPSTTDISQYANVLNTSKKVIQTPSTAAKYVSPNKKRLFRKRKATPENWKKKKISGKDCGLVDRNMYQQQEKLFKRNKSKNVTVQNVDIIVTVKYHLNKDVKSETYIMNLIHMKGKKITSVQEFRKETQGHF